MSMLLVGTLLSTNSLAQTRERLDWPRTFGGQPDFEFTRDEVLKEAATNATRQGLPTPEAPTMEDLLEDVSLTPLDEPTISPTTVSAATGTVSGTTGVTASVIADLLPSLKPKAELDLTEFRTTMQMALAGQVKAYELDPTRTDASYLLKALKLDTIVTSPFRYAIINGQRYQVGETITIPLALGPSDTDQLALLETLMPPPDSLSESLYQQYQEVQESVVKDLATAKQSNPMQYQKVFDLPVTLVDLQPRGVVVQFQGQRYELAIPYRY